MDDTFFESLLNARESETLDFKSDYYFAKSNEGKKSELLKDVLAFANSQRDVPPFNSNSYPCFLSPYKTCMIQ